MGKIETITFEQAVALLRAEDPKGREDEIAMYARAFCQYREAEANIAKNGSIVAHPRTGAPIDNPYLRVQATAMRSMQQLRRLKTDGLWR
jgi:phage terminase small subunit